MSGPTGGPGTGAPDAGGLPVGAAPDTWGTRCPFCFQHKTAGKCLTQGCRSPASGFQVREPRYGPCVTCSATTSRWVPMALSSAVERPGGEELSAIGVPFCELCDQRWRLWKLERFLTLKGIKESLRQETAELVQQWRAEGIEPLEEAE